MNNIFETTYDCNGRSIITNTMGMREMQMRIYKKYASQYLLLKAPPASGKSRALMFVALEKLRTGLVKKSNCCSTREIYREIIRKYKTYREWFSYRLGGFSKI